MSIFGCCFPVSNHHYRGSHLTYSFPSTEKPQYKKGCTVNVAFASLGFCIMTGMTLYYRMENRRRDKVEGGRPVPGTQLETVEKFDLAPGKH